MTQIVVHDYDAVWPREFIRLCVYLSEFLARDCLAIRHVGSTSVPGLASKAILDIDIVLLKNEDFTKVRSLLEAHGYTFRGDLDIAGRFAFGYGGSSFMRHHLYVVQPKARSYLDHITLREALRADPSAVAQYAITKRSLAIRFAQDIDAYIEGKSDVIKLIMSSTTGIETRLFNGQLHTKEILEDNRIRMQTSGDFPGEILFTSVPFEILAINGTDSIRKHLIGLAREIALGYQ